MERENFDESVHRRQLCQQEDDAAIARWEDEGGRLVRGVLDEATPVADAEASDLYGRWIVDTLRCFLLPKEEAAEVSAQIIAEIERRLSHVLRTATLTALLPAIRRRAERFYQSQGVPFSDAEELAGKLVVKVLEGLEKEGFRGNPGAWISRIRFTILMDFWRQKRRERNRLGNRQDAALLADVHDMAVDEASLKLLIEELPTDVRELVWQAIRGDEWPAIAAPFERKLEELKVAVESLEWPEGSAPLRKRRRRRSS